MLCRLAAEERAYLTEHFRFLEEDGSAERISLGQLKDPEFLKGFLECLKTELDTDSTLAAASQLMKRVGYLAAVPPLYTAAVFGKALDMDFDACFLVQRRQGDVWMPRLFLADASAVDLGGEERHVRFERFACRLFADLAEVVQAVSAAAPVPRSLLWENIAIYVYWLYESRLMEECDNGVRLQAWRDFEFILHELPPSVFGERTNPLYKFHKEKTVSPSGEEAVRIRQTCCFAYETGKGKSFCKTCPKKIEKVHL
jgi:ferric iron reductase protein FhuF